ncbi:hypothetical protein [Natronococcus sp.]|uniref:hypothetical protein n=1 Tax=Natronococcus sp. TaxID=35747 RepID=UPI003A4D65BF
MIGISSPLSAGGRVSSSGWSTASSVYRPSPSAATIGAEFDPSSSIRESVLVIVRASGTGCAEADRAGAEDAEGGPARDG